MPVFKSMWCESLNSPDFLSSIILAPLILAVFIGTNFGKKILYFIPEDTFRYFFKGALTIIAIKLIITELI